MALKRLDEEFELKPGTQLLPYMKRLLPSLEGRFQSLEATADAYSMVMEEIRASALMRMNEILIPATEDIIEVTKLGFLLAPSSTPITLELGVKYFTVDEGSQRDSFTPSPYVLVEREANIDDYAIARVLDYVQATGELVLQITAHHGNPGPHSDWVISSTPGMADSTKLYHDAVGPMHDTVVADAAQVAQDKIEIMAAIEALEAAGLDVNAFIRRDGTVPFIQRQIGVAPAPGANDAYLVTAAWSRARMIEYAGLNVTRSGDQMTGPLYLARNPVGSSEAATKSYVDASFGAGGIINGMVTIQTVQPTLRLQSTGTQQYRMIEARSSGSATRWVLALADNAVEPGDGGGSDFRLLRHGDTGVYIDSPLSISRLTGVMTTKGLIANGDVDINGMLDVMGDISAYRPGAPGSGALYLNQSKSAYHLFDGANHVLAGGGLSLGSGSLTVGHIASLSINTQGHPTTTWGLTSNGAATIVGPITMHHTNLTLYGAGSNYIQLHDSDWGPMYIHHNQNLIGFLSHAGGWINYTTNDGHIWTPMYGWIHDYVNNTASHHAWTAANYRYNQLVSTLRWVYAGDPHNQSAPNRVYEPANGCAITGWYAGTDYKLYHLRIRQLQCLIAGGWYAVGYA